MYYLAFGLLLLAFLASIGGAVPVALALFHGYDAQEAKESTRLAEYAHMAQLAALGIASLILCYAFISYDFSVVYVADYSDRALSLFYRITAFWAGQPGSLLFWAFSVVLAGALFQCTGAYKHLGVQVQCWYWIFFFAVTAFFGLLLTGWNNPFLLYEVAPADGSGLNPLLQHPGMIIHPPLLFLGYGGFVIPGCLALAQALCAKDVKDFTWPHIVRPFTISAWVFLSAGIILGAWWSYMELGWGGYWAWDPVENASLIPWLVATAALHTLLVQTRRNKLHRTNVFLMALTTISAFFATYLVRGNIVDSLHAFGGGGIATPLLLFILATTLLALAASLIMPTSRKETLTGLDSREGFLMFSSWILLILSLVILLATLWPVISVFFSGNKIGLGEAFYNRVCLPLFTLLTLLLAVCPWLRWEGGLADSRKLGIILGVFVASAAGVWSLGYHLPMTLISAAAASAAIVSSLLYLFAHKGYRNLPRLGAVGVHIGLVLMVLGVAFSGPYKLEQKTLLKIGQSLPLGNYQVKLVGLKQDSRDDYTYDAAFLELYRANKLLGSTVAERRHYPKRGQSFAESGVIFSFGQEFYASLMDVSPQGDAIMQYSLNPLVNWLWVGGVLMCLAPLVGIGKVRRKDH